MSASRHLDVAAAMAMLDAARAVFLDFPEQDDDALSLARAAAKLSVSVDWVRGHLTEFPNAWRLPAGQITTATGGKNVGEIRIPLGDIREFQRRQRIQRAPQPALA